MPKLKNLFIILLSLLTLSSSLFLVSGEATAATFDGNIDHPALKVVIQGTPPASITIKATPRRYTDDNKVGVNSSEFTNFKKVNNNTYELDAFNYFRNDLTWNDGAHMFEEDYQKFFIYDVVINSGQIGGSKTANFSAAGSGGKSITLSFDAPATTPTSKPGSITGKIFCRDTNKLLIKCKMTSSLELADLNNKVIQTTSNSSLNPDANNFYSFKNVAPGKYKLRGSVGPMNDPNIEHFPGGLFEETIEVISSKETLAYITVSGDQSGVTVSDKEPVNETTPNSDPTCESEGGSFSWIMCPALELVSGILNFMDSQLNSLLNLPEQYYKNNSTVTLAWQRMRNLAFIILIPVMLVMVIGTALGFKFVDAYTVKRSLPRLLVAIVFISLSLPIVTIMADIANGVGKGMMGFIVSSVTEQNASTVTLASLFNPSEGVGLIGSISLIGLGILALGMIGTLLIFGITAALSMLVLFFVMALRQMLLVTLMILSPLAIISWIFPGNDKLWKIWWESFSKLLLLYPIIMLLLAAGKVFAYIVHDVSPGTMLNTVLILVGYIGPYFLIKSTFKMAGNVFGNLAGMANDRSKGVFDRLSKARQKRYKSKWHDATSGKYFKNASKGSLKYKFNTGLENLTNQNLGGLELRPTIRKARMQGALHDRALEHAMEASEKLPGARAHFASDVLMMGGLEGQGDREKTMQYYRNQGFDENQARSNTERVLQMRNDMGAEAYELAAIAKLPGTGTAFEEKDIAKWHQHIARASHGDASLEASLVAAGKSGFNNAQRYEVGMAGFSDHMDAVKMARTAKTPEDISKISDFIVDKSYEGGGPDAVIASRNAKSARMFAQAINRSIEKGEKSGDHTKDMRAKAAANAVHEGIGRAKQVVGSTLADEVFAKTVTMQIDQTIQKRVGQGSNFNYETEVVRIPKEVTRLVEIQSHKQDKVFQESKFEYDQTGGRTPEEIEALRRQAQQNPPKPGGFTPPNPGGGMPGGPKP